MPNSEPPETNSDSDDGAGVPSDLAESIQQDFRTLVEVLDRLLEITDEADRGTATALWAAHAAAKRGLQLSERLSKCANKNNDEGEK